jgi:myo-inositol 2-dehydrogenase / D-chiro-inositol 1-dehydrogenase
VNDDVVQTDRRDFLKLGAAAAVTSALMTTGAYAAGSDEIKVGIIGCGGRGTGAGEDVLRAAKGVKIWAMGDAFEDRLKGSQRHLENQAKDNEDVKKHGNTVEVNGRTFTGLDAYKKVIDSGANYIILATPPGFRPLHIEATINAGKSLFTEKPVGVDAPGIRKVLTAYEVAKKNNIAVGAGTQRRHQTGYLEVMKRIHAGEIGTFVGGHCHWDMGILWKTPRQKGWGDLEAQMRNWYNYTWLCGDHIVEQHVHNLDVINWAAQAHPIAVLGMGFRTRTDPQFGHIYDFFSCDFEYADGVHVASTCRQISNCDNNVSEGVRGSKGYAEVNRYRINGKSVFNGRKDNAPYIAEHTDLIASIRKNEPINELKNVAESTMTAIMGRMSAYTGMPLTWKQALESRETLMPENLAWDMKLPEPPVAIPGKTKFV